MKAFLASPRVKFFALVAGVSVVLDQWSKYWAVSALTRAFDGAQGFGDRLTRFLFTRHPSRSGVVAVIDDFWHFRYAENPGAAWSFLANTPDWVRVPFFLLVSLVAMGFIVHYYRKTPDDQRPLLWAFALIFGGALGNFLDRVRLGYVIDFIDWHWYEKATWPTFNVADAAITIGVALMALDMSKHRQTNKVRAAKPAH